MPWVAFPIDNSVLSGAVAPHVFALQSLLAEPSVTFGARVHFRTAESAQQLAEA